MSDTTHPSKAMPVQAGERIEFVDILRGFAVFGILVANMASYSGMSRDPQAWTEPIDRAILILTRFLVEAKFYSLFSLLFGWGMAVQMARARARGGRFVPLYLRRLLILLIFGLLHAFFIWSGDILATYALCGGLLLLFRRRSEPVLLLASGLALLSAIIVTMPGEAMEAFRTWYENLTSFLRSDTYPESLYATGTYWEITRLRIQDYLAGNSWFIYWFGNVFGMFLLGLFVGKRRIFHNVNRHLTLMRVVMGVGLVIGLIFNGIYVLAVVRPDLVPSEYHRMVTRGARTIGAPALMLFYVSGIILLVRQEVWHRRLAPLASVGRSALSNYLLQSVVCTLLFYGYGLGAYGQIDPLLALILTIVIFLAQVRLSEWWFSHSRFGPMEWLWRTLTYGKIQPLRRKRMHRRGAPALWRRARHAAASVDPKRALAVAWVVLLIWATALVFWTVRLERQVPQVSAEMPYVEARATATPPTVGAEEQPDGNPSPERVEVLATPVVQPVAYEPGPLAASGDLFSLASAFRVELALDQIETLTGPPYLGRYTGSPQAWAAGDYVASEFARYGLQPAGDDGTFFQAFPVEYIALATEPSFVIEGPDGTPYDQYELHQDYSAIVRWYSGAGTAEGQVIWANDCTGEDFTLVEVSGKIVLCRSQSIREAERNALEHGAAGLLLLTDPAQRPPDFGNTYFEPWVPEPIPVLRVFPTAVDELLLGTDKSVEDLSISFTPFPLATHARLQVQTTGPEVCPAQGCQGRNVLGVIPGRDPEYTDQVIILGAHYDHIGQAPTGIVWPGANDDASGVAVLLEIARTWQEQGYVPRHTVLFAAWDAEEVGLVGSSHYVQHPRYPLENTVAMIQLDMVGAGGDTLWIDGEGDLGEHLRSVAKALGVETDITNAGRSDHVPFMSAGIPADLLIWRFDNDDAQYHRPLDTPDTIELDKLDVVGQIVGLTVLGLTEGDPAINELLARRAVAVKEGDLDAFLDTSLPEQEAADRLWFADLQALSPDHVEMRMTDARILGRTATATVRMTARLPAGSWGETDIRTAALAARFMHDGQGWRWAGPNLVQAGGGAGFAVAHPPELDGGHVGLGESAAVQYAAMAARLELPAAPDAALLLFPDSESLRASTSLSLPSGRDTWVGPGTLKLTYSEGISSSLQLADGLAQLLLAEAGVTEAAAPWLWHGLPLVLRTPADPAETRAQILPGLQEALAEQTVPATEETSWAAVDYLQRQVGWRGMGQFITTLGRACRDGLCASSEGLDLALASTSQMDAHAFEAAWQEDWRQRLAAAQAGLDTVLAARTRAILAGDEVAFLSTVDPDVPNLLAEERHWFADLARLAPETFSLTGNLVALLADGSFLAKVTLDNAQVPLSVRFTEKDGEYHWAGIPFETLQQGSVTVLYPQRQKELAQAVSEEAITIYDRLLADLSLEAASSLTLKLYDGDDAFQASISPAFQAGNWVPAWTGHGESVRLRLPPEATAEDLRPTLAVQLARHLLADMGVDSEWLLKGVSLYLAGNFDGGVSTQAAADNLHRVLQAIPKEGLYDLEAMPPDYELSTEDLDLAHAQAWDTVRYLVQAHGRDALADLVQAQAQGQSPNAALRSVTGRTLLEFETLWADSLARAHALPDWIEIANGFDPERATRHVEALADPALAGRRAGSAGAEAAAAYIAEQFAAAGLLPASKDSSFFQSLPITDTALLSAPRLELVDDGGQTLDAFVYRQDFVIPADALGAGGLVVGELVWVGDEDYQQMDLVGKIVVRRPSGDASAEVALAAERGASGLILAGDKESLKELLAKVPLPLQPPSDQAIPVLELTQEGVERLLMMIGQVKASSLDAAPAQPLGIEARIEIPIGPPLSAETVNVLGLLPGSDPALEQEVIILGAHYDHVGDDPDALLCSADAPGTSGHAPNTTCEQVEGRRYAGANDDASGVGVLLEIARLWRETGYQPRRSVLFVAWGAQEAGELGSRYYVENPVLPLEQTVAMLQLDAVGGGRGYYLEAQGGGEREGLLLFNLMVAEDWVDGRLAFKDKWNQSDQVSFREVGIPTLLLTWREASEENWPVEIADLVEPYRLGVTGRMVSLALMTLAR